MPAKILYGKPLAAVIQHDLRDQIKLCTSRGQRAPGLAVVLIGEDPASSLYVKNKLVACESVGILSSTYRFSASVTQKELLELVFRLNTTDTIDGILIQLPLPPHIDRQAVLESIDPQKDVDGFHPFNQGRLLQQQPTIHPCTPAGIMRLLKETHCELTGLHATIIGTSDIVGRPMLSELLMENCTVTLCHLHTQNLKELVLQSDLLVVAIGDPGFIKGEWIKPGAIVIDVGINRMDNGSFMGDVEFAAAEQRAGWITPVPGGVGPLTVATLLTNTFGAYEKLVKKTDTVL